MFSFYCSCFWGSDEGRKGGEQGRVEVGDVQVGVGTETVGIGVWALVCWGYCGFYYFASVLMPIYFVYGLILYKLFYFSS